MRFFVSPALLAAALLMPTAALAWGERDIPLDATSSSPRPSQQMSTEEKQEQEYRRQQMKKQRQENPSSGEKDDLHIQQSTDGGGVRG